MKIVVPILKNCLGIYERFKRHILCMELHIVEKYDVLERGSANRLQTKATYTLCPSYFERKIGEEKDLGRTCMQVGARIQQTRPSRDTNMINILYKRNVKTLRRDFRKARETSS